MLQKIKLKALLKSYMLKRKNIEKQSSNVNLLISVGAIWLAVRNPRFKNWLKLNTLSSRIKLFVSHFVVMY